jgi:hypothetical protein
MFGEMFLLHNFESGPFSQSMVQIILRIKPKLICLLLMTCTRFGYHMRYEHMSGVWSVGEKMDVILDF